MPNGHPTEPISWSIEIARIGTSGHWRTRRQDIDIAQYLAIFADAFYDNRDARDPRITESDEVTGRLERIHA